MILIYQHVMYLLLLFQELFHNCFIMSAMQILWTYSWRLQMFIMFFVDDVVCVSLALSAMCLV